jgi:hypothetical protein
VTTFLSSLGSKLADRWVSMLLLPGALVVAAVACARLLGHRHALDVDSLGRQISALPLRHPGSGLAAAIGVLLASAAAGLLAQAIGRAAEVISVGRWRGPLAPLARLLTRVRVSAATRNAKRTKVDPVPVYLPDRPTWIGEQFRLLDVRVAAQYHGLRLALLWPRLWVVLPAEVRAVVQAANDQFRTATVLIGWGVLYLVIGCWWFPAAGVGLVTVVTGWRRTRTYTTTLTTLIEAVVDTHLTTVTGLLNISLPETGLSPTLARTINDRLQKGG